MSARYAVIIGGVVVNCIVYDPSGDWGVPIGDAVVASDAAQIGDDWDGSHFSYIDLVGGFTVR